MLLYSSFMPPFLVKYLSYMAESIYTTSTVHMEPITKLSLSKISIKPL